MEYLSQQLINGVTLGSIYALIAIGYTMVYGIVGMINFAHGDIVMVGSFTSLILIIIFGITSALAPALIVGGFFIILLASMFLTAVWGWTVERLAYRPLRKSFRLAPLITAIGMSIVLQNFVQLAQGARVKPLQPIITGGYILSDHDGLAVNLSNVQIIIIVLTLVLLVIFSLAIVWLGWSLYSYLFWYQLYQS